MEMLNCTEKRVAMKVLRQLTCTSRLTVNEFSPTTSVQCSKSQNRRNSAVAVYCAVQLVHMKRGQNMSSSCDVVGILSIKGDDGCSCQQADGQRN